MMKKIKQIRSLISSYIKEKITAYLPEASRDLILAENRRLERKAAALEEENRELRAYLHGMETGLRSIRKIVINNNGKGDKR